MARKKAIPQEIRDQVIEIVARFNADNTTEIPNTKIDMLMAMLGSGRSKSGKSYRVGEYVPRFRGSYLYLDRAEFGKPTPICRLKWTGDMNDWEFAIYKYSDNAYDPEEWLFPGAESVDGTIEGALYAGNEAYPI